MLFILIHRESAYGQLVQAQICTTNQYSKEVFVDNEHMVVTKYLSHAGQDICAPDELRHPAHLSIFAYRC
jgi:hypothetical protein